MAAAKMAMAQQWLCLISVAKHRRKTESSAAASGGGGGGVMASAKAKQRSAKTPWAKETLALPHGVAAGGWLAKNAAALAKQSIMQNQSGEISAASTSRHGSMAAGVAGAWRIRLSAKRGEKSTNGCGGVRNGENRL